MWRHAQEQGRSPAGGGQDPAADGPATTRVPARARLLTVTVDERDEAVVLSVTGEVDGLTAPRLHDAVCGAYDHLDGRVLVVDLTAVRLFGSPGLHVLTPPCATAEHVVGCPDVAQGVRR